MKDYTVQIKEILTMTVTIEAASAADARDIVERRWKDGEYILDAAHFQGVSFTVPTRHERER